MQTPKMDFHIHFSTFFPLYHYIYKSYGLQVGINVKALLFFKKYDKIRKKCSTKEKKMEASDIILRKIIVHILDTSLEAPVISA